MRVYKKKGVRIIENLINGIECILKEVKPYEFEFRNINLLKKGILDSLAIMVLVNELEYAYDIEIENDDIIQSNFETIEDIAKLVQKYKGD